MGKWKVPVAEPEITKSDVASVFNCLNDEWISGVSPYVTNFEKKFAKWNNIKEAIFTQSGTNALTLSGAALGIGKGDEVIMPTLTMIACPNSMTLLGAKPVFVDSHRKHWCIDEKLIEKSITPKTKAIMPVHLYGHPARMDLINDIAEQYDLKVIEDCAEAHGAELYGRKVGTFGDVGVYSFYANKIMTTGEGGMIVTNDSKIAEKCRWLRAHAFGKDGKHFWHEQYGFGYRASGLQAALGLSQLERVDTYINRHIQNAKYYMALLMPLKIKGQISFPPQLNVAKNVYWMFTILIEDSFGMSRDEVIKVLEDNGYETRTTFYPMHVQPIYKTEGRFTVANKIAAKGINLPSANTLNSKDIYDICQLLRKISGDLEEVEMKEQACANLEVVEVDGQPVVSTEDIKEINEE